MPSSFNVNFPELTFTSPGKYIYKVKELTPSGNKWKADSRVYRIVVTVTEDSYGELEATVEYPDGFPKFVNKYSEGPPPKPPCNPCKHFNCLPFPMLWFAPPQKEEFKVLIKESPHVFDNDWWEKLFNNMCDK